MAKYIWSNIQQLEDAIASGRFSAEALAAIPGLATLSMAARRDAVLSELLAGGTLTAGAVSIDDEGADPTGVLDSTAAIISAIDKAATSGRIVFVPTIGTYKVTPGTVVTDEAGTVTVAFVMRSNMHIQAVRGAVFKLADGQSTDAVPKRLGMFHTTGVLSNVSFSGLTMDMNGANNKISPSRPVSYNLYNMAHIAASGTPGGVAARIDDVLIDDCRFINTPGVSCIIMAQSNTAGVTLGKRWTIRNCLFNNNGLDTSDHSSIYGWADDVLIDNCRFIADSMWGTVGKTGPVTAYEMHGKNHQFVNNFVWNHYAGMWVAANKTSAVENGLVANNVFGAIAAIGVDFAREAANDQPVRKILIADNVIQLTDDAVAPLTLKSAFQLEAEYALSDIVFEDNRIDKTGSTIAATGLYVTASNTAAQKHTGIVFRDNEVRNTTLGVLAKTTATNGLGVLEMGGNRFVDLTATASNPVAAGIMAITLPSALDQLTIHPNSFVDDRGGVAFDNGILLGNGTITNLFVGAQSYRGIVANYTESSLTVTNRTDDLVVSGGYRQAVSGWYQTNIPAAQAATEATRGDGRFLAPSPGSVLGIQIALDPSQARSAGTLTAEVWVATIDATTGARTETATGLTAVLDGTNPVKKLTSQAKDLDLFTNGDEIFVKFTTDGSWAPTTADPRCTVFVEC